MTRPFFIALSLLSFSASSQELKKILFHVETADEPPTEQGETEYRIEFVKSTDGFIAENYFKDNNRIKLGNPAKVDATRVTTLMKWKSAGKDEFALSDLDVDVASLRERAGPYELNFEIPDAMTIKLDSFQFCQNYWMTKTIATGGSTIVVTLIDDRGKQTKSVFKSPQDVGARRFNLRDYLLCYMLLHGAIPDVIPGDDFFSKPGLLQLILYYQKTIECEGYYYQEFTDKNPQMSAREKRAKTGWNFAAYLRRRSGID